jgi:hypothetical protein
MLLFIEEPWITLHVFVYGSGHASGVDVGMPLRVDEGILQFDIPDRESINQID